MRRRDFVLHVGSCEVIAPPWARVVLPQHGGRTLQACLPWRRQLPSGGAEKEALTKARSK